MQIEIHKDNLQRYIKEKLSDTDTYSILGVQDDVLTVEITLN